MIQKKIVLHGHFYQPPRENPWTGFIDRQESAYPYNDWNARINTECYAACTRTPVLEQGEVIKIINCFEYLSFNIGPTLLSWMDTKYGDKETIKKIIEGDQISIARNNGHGNAIAQVYSHMIMPLANQKDQYTQVLWGLQDFKMRFGRESEGIWLGETAINNETATILVDCGIKFVILSPFQAKSVSKNGEILNVLGGSIDPSKPYRLNTKNGVLSVFFYDPNLASEISFGRLLDDATQLYKAIKNTFSYQTGDIQLVHTATDGEVYGHHKNHGNMALARFIHDITKINNSEFQFTNYGKFLADHPAVEECELFLGDQGEGSSWSCAHGVGRWIRDCGCHTGGQVGWNQKWRTPLRESFDLLRDSIHTAVEKESKELLKNVWDARNDYFNLIVSNTDEECKEFFEKHQKRNLLDIEKEFVFRMMESLRYAMLMYTSCGWFFSDISGIETVQDILYAARAYDFVKDIVDPSIYTSFKDLLNKATSNKIEEGSGKDILKKSIEQYEISLETLRDYICFFIVYEVLTEQISKIKEFAITEIWEQKANNQYVYHFKNDTGFSSIVAFSLLDTEFGYGLYWREILSNDDTEPYRENNYWNRDKEWKVTLLSSLPLFLRIRLIARSIQYEIEQGYQCSRDLYVLSLNAVLGAEKYLLPNEKKALVYYYVSKTYYFTNQLTNNNNLEDIKEFIRGTELLKKCAISVEEIEIFLESIAVALKSYLKRALASKDIEMLKNSRIIFWAIRGYISSKQLDILRDIIYHFYKGNYQAIKDSDFLMEFKTIMKDMGFSISIIK